MEIFVSDVFLFGLSFVMSIRPSGSLSVCISAAASTGRIFVKFDIGDFYENLLRNPNLVKIG
jgi:hypothetical protein